MADSRRARHAAADSAPLCTCEVFGSPHVTAWHAEAPTPARNT